MAAISLLAASFAALPIVAQQQPPAAPPQEQEHDTTQLHARFAEKMSGVKLTGKFTILGQQQDRLPTEEYTIQSVAKLPQGDYWMITARIKYAEHDLTIPMPLEVKWAGDTPVITLTKMTIPGLGTFSSRVVFHEDKYAGTWSHGEVGGHMFGVVEKLTAAAEEKKEGDR